MDANVLKCTVVHIFLGVASGPGHLSIILGSQPSAS